MKKLWWKYWYKYIFFCGQQLFSEIIYTTWSPALCSLLLACVTMTIITIQWSTMLLLYSCGDALLSLRINIGQTLFRLLARSLRVKSRRLWSSRQLLQWDFGYALYTGHTRGKSVVFYRGKYIMMKNKWWKWMEIKKRSPHKSRIHLKKWFMRSSCERF